MKFYRNDDPPDSPPCAICHYSADDCTCPVCLVCGEQGNPFCINRHMKWERWPHFSFTPSLAKIEAERQYEKEQAEFEKKLDDSIDRL